MDPEKKSLNSIFPTKYVIPKSLKFSHWPSKLMTRVYTIFSKLPFGPCHVGTTQDTTQQHSRGSVASTMRAELAGRTLVKVLVWIKLETVLPLFVSWSYIYRAKCVCK